MSERKDGSVGTLLDTWRPPHGAGDPLGCLATTFTFDPLFYEEECLARFLEIDSLPDREGLAFRLERENRLGGSYAGVLVDQQQAGVDHSLRWDVLAVRVPRATQHAKLSLLAWTNHVRVVVASANLTPNGYRTNQEVSGTIDFAPDAADRELCDACCTFLERLIRFVPGSTTEGRACKRAAQFLTQVRRQIASWEEPSHAGALLRQHLVFTLPPPPDPTTGEPDEGLAESALESCLRICRSHGQAPSRVRVASPFFDADEQDAGHRLVAALCKGMGRKVSRRLTFCVPAIGQEDGAVRLAAPRAIYRTAWDRVDIVNVAVLPHADADRNLRPWHAKMLWLERERYAALMVGSSNFTKAGMGVGPVRNAEANLLYVARRRAYARAEGDLGACWPSTETVKNPDEAEWIDPFELTNEGGDAPRAPMVPAGFVAAEYSAGDHPALVVRLATGKLPATWQILGGAGHRTMVVDSTIHADLGRPASVSVPWAQEEAPGKLLVRWEGRQAFWSVNVEDQAQLPIPREIEGMSVADLLAILAASDSSAAFRAWARAQGASAAGFDDDLDSALPVDLDPLRRYDLRETFLRRVRRQARQLAAVRRNLERPAWSEHAIDWRLRGIIGIERLAQRLCGPLKEPDGRASEAVLALADLLLMLSEVAYRPALGSLSRVRFYRAFKPFLSELAADLDQAIRSVRRFVSSDVRAFWRKVYERCRT